MVTASALSLKHPNLGQQASPKISYRSALADRPSQNLYLPYHRRRGLST